MTPVHASPSTARSAVKAAAQALQHVLRHSPTLSRLYLNAAGATARALPDGGWKTFVGNALQSTSWPELNLPPARASYPGGIISARIVPHLGEFDFWVHVSQQLAYEPEVFAWLNGRQYATILEIGANVGVFSLFLAKRFPQAQVYSFEPSRTVFARLLTNLALNPEVTNLHPYNCAIYPETGFLTFYEPAGHLTNGSFHADFAAQFAATRKSFVPALGPDALAPLLAQSPVLIKIDVEGAEPEVLASLRGIIEQHRPDLVIEVLPGVADQLNQLDWLSRRYRFFNLKPAGAQERADFQASEHRDYALLPRSA